MKKLVLAAVASIAMTGAASADPIFGTWQTIADDNGNYGHIQVRDCGDRGICGTLVQSFDGSGATFVSENKGRAIIWDMEADGGGAYSGGKVWSPDRDKTYSSRMQLSGNSLSVQGCVFGICRDGGSWSRVN
jgi:uncharacterized protein (DUF2147 family)